MELANPALRPTAAPVTARSSKSFPQEGGRTWQHSALELTGQDCICRKGIYAPHMPSKLCSEPGVIFLLHFPASHMGKLVSLLLTWASFFPTVATP